MEYSSLVEIVSAAHLTKYVQSPFPQRSGLFLVAPPGAFKTTIAETMDEYPSTQVISNLNTQSVNMMKEHMLAGTISTLAFSDYGALYRRHGSVASGVEGVIMALADEGYRRPQWQAQNSPTMPAYCTIVGGMTSAFFDEKIPEWQKNGFARRFVFARYQLNGIETLEDAAAEWRRAELDGSFVPRIPSSRTIQYKLDPKEVEYIRHMCRHIQDGKVNNFVMMQKIACVLKWKFGKENKHMQILKDFAPCLTKNGGTLQIREKKKEAMV